MKRLHLPINDGQRKYRGFRGGKQESHGPVKVIFSRDANPVIDPPTKNGMQAGRLRQNAPACERLLWDALKSIGARFGVPFQHSVALYGYVADFYCPSLNVVIELDGYFHKNRQQHDRCRDAALQGHGIRTLRFPSVLAHADMDGLLGQIVQELGLKSCYGEIVGRAECESETGRDPPGHT